jgi:tRNA nucleotidyltransferase (CCA-adding enzyme)
LNLNLLPEDVKKSISSDAPKSIADLDISGNDLMALGYKGQEVGNILKDVIMNILRGKLNNSKEEILNYIKS